MARRGGYCCFCIPSSWIYRPLKWTLYLTLLTLPLTLVPFLAGSIEACFFHAAREAHSQAEELLLASDIDAAAWMDQFSVPGAPGIHEVARQPFFVRSIRSPMDWWEKMGMKRTNFGPKGLKHQLPLMDKLIMPIDSYDSLKTEWHHFLYVSEGRVHLHEDTLTNEWDKAFNELVKHHYMDPAVGGANFSYIRDSHFLPHMWYAKGPALVHFTTARVEDPESPYFETEEEKMSSIPGYRRVGVRVVEFAKGHRVEAVRGIMPGVFPSPYEQMLALTGSDFEWQLHGSYSQAGQIFTRFYQLCDEKMVEYPLYSKLHRAKEALDQIVRKSIADTSSLVQVPYMTGFFGSLLPLFAASRAYRMMSGLVALFLGVDSEAMAKAKEEKLRMAVYTGFTMEQQNVMEELLDSYVNQLPEDAAQLLKESPEVLDEARRLARSGGTDGATKTK